LSSGGIEPVKSHGRIEDNHRFLGLNAHDHHWWRVLSFKLPPCFFLISV
jgi:hypothetical protein